MKRKILYFGSESIKIKLLIVVILILSLAACQAGDGADEGTITTSVISTGDIQISAFGSGTLISANEVELGFDYGGEIEQILVEVGDVVEEGETLAVFETEELQEALDNAEENLRELTSDAAVSSAALELAEAQKDVLTAESTLSFFLSPYVFKSELRLQEAQEELNAAIQAVEDNPSDAAEERVLEAQEALDHAELSLELNYETYYDEYVPDFFDFKWKDPYIEPWIGADGELHFYWHHYYDPPSEIEVAEVWAELAAAEARVEEAEFYLAALTEDQIPGNGYGSQLVMLENAVNAVMEAEEKLEAATLVAPSDGVVIEISKEEGDQIGTTSLITVAKLEPPTLEASFDEGDWSLIKEGNPVKVVFDSLEEKTYTGEIVFVNPTLQENRDVTYVSALVELDPSEIGWSGLPLSSRASLEVIASETIGAVLLPIDGLQESSGSQGTVLIMSGDEFISREVELGLWDVLFVEVLDGLSAGEVVLIGELE